MLGKIFQKFANKVASNFKGKDVSYGQTDRLGLASAAYLQSLGLNKGDRIAVIMSNVPQYPVTAACTLRAGLVLVKVNPLHTLRESSQTEGGYFSQPRLRKYHMGTKALATIRPSAYG